MPYRVFSYGDIPKDDHASVAGDIETFLTKAEADGFNFVGVIPQWTQERHSGHTMGPFFILHEEAEREEPPSEVWT